MFAGDLEAEVRTAAGSREHKEQAMASETNAGGRRATPRFEVGASLLRGISIFLSNKISWQVDPAAEPEQIYMGA